ncbi:MAG: hypothetical protein KKA79_00425 [Nanoarchaeota archaeon]|nr:hypothetical protein [Nanoarchaeota archaeon]MCG2718126.1 hypothetical protein [Nanoarchaeota archaeon]
MKGKKLASVLAAGIFGAGVLLGSVPTYAKEEAPIQYVEEQNQSKESVHKKEVDTNIPHYLKGLTPISELTDVNEIEKEIRKTAEIFRMYESQTYSGMYDFVKISNYNEEETVNIYGKDIKIVYHEYMKKGDKILYTNPLGIEELTLEEFEVVKNDIKEQVKLAVDANVEAYKTLPGKIKTELEKLLEIKDLDAIADQKIPEYDGITYGDVLGYFKLEGKDFVPDELHLALIPALGLSIVNAKLVMYSPIGRSQDYILGFPSTLAHEFTHASTKIQSIPFSWQFDAELQASYVQLGENQSFLTYLLHDYLAPFRETEKRYFSFDANHMLKKILGADKASNYTFHEEEMAKEFPLMDQVREEFKKSMPDFFAEYYTNRLFWYAVNHKFNDPNVWFDILMAQKYEPTIYAEGDKENKGAFDDLQFLKEVEDAGVLEEIRTEAWKRTEGEETKKDRTTMGPKYEKLMRLSHLYHVDPFTIQRFLEKEGIDDIYNIPPEKLNQLEIKIDKILEGFVK